MSESSIARTRVSGGTLVPRGRAPRMPAAAGILPARA